MGQTSLDHLVRALLQKPRHVEAEGLRGLEIDDQLELGRLHDGQIAGFFPSENASDITR
jgi:hypothetical protein